VGETATHIDGSHAFMHLKHRYHVVHIAYEIGEPESTSLITKGETVLPEAHGVIRVTDIVAYKRSIK
jgi:hypothetical protein